jgi:hypothetical protein
MLAAAMLVSGCSGKKNVAVEVPVESVQFGGEYERLLPKQRELVDQWYRQFNQIMTTDLVPESGYDKMPLSVRTSFEAVTHALINSQLTTEKGTKLGSAIDLVDAVETVKGQAMEGRGDSQFRIFVVLRQDAVEILKRSREFSRGHDNTIYHKGYPLNYRQGGTPSIQFSVTRNEERADIDVDYRSSAFPMVLFDGHLTSANSDVRAGNNYSHHVRKWEGFLDWWKSLFGLRVAAPQVTVKADWEVEEDPPITDDEEITVAVKGMLESWLLEQDPNTAASYLGPAALDCVLAVRGENNRTDLAQFHMLHQMKLVNQAVGETQNLSQVIRPLPSKSESAQMLQHQNQALFSLYEIPNHAVNAYMCPPSEGFKQIDHSRERRKHYAVVFEIVEPNGKKEALLQIWASDTAHWRMMAFHQEFESAEDLIPDLLDKAAAVPADSPAHPTGNPELVATVEKFFSTWIVDRDFETAANYFSNHAHDCTNLFLDSEKQPPHSMPSEAHRHLVDGLRLISERIASTGRLKDSLLGVSSWHPDVRVVQHPHETAYMLASVPQEISEPLACGERTEEPPIHEGLETLEGQHYLSAFQLKGTMRHPPAIFFLWAQAGSDWKIVTYHIEVH